MNEMKRLRLGRMSTEEKRNSVMAGFMRSNYGLFEKGTYYNPVIMHQVFSFYVESNPVDRPVKYRCLFPFAADGENRITKIIFRDFLDKILELPRNTKDRSYWIRNEEVAREMNERIEQLTFQGKRGKLMVHTKLKDLDSH